MSLKVIIAIAMLLILPLLCGFVFNTISASRKAKTDTERRALEASGKSGHIYGLPAGYGAETKIISKENGLEFTVEGKVVALPARRVVSAAEMSGAELGEYMGRRGISCSAAPDGTRALAIEYRTVESTPKTVAVYMEDEAECFALCRSILRFARGKAVSDTEWNKIVL